VNIPKDGDFAKDGDPNTKIPMSLGKPTVPGGPLTIPVAPPKELRPVAAPSAPPAPPTPTVLGGSSGPTGQFKPDGPYGPGTGGAPVEVVSNIPQPNKNQPIPVTPKDPSKVSPTETPRGTLGSTWEISS
jgi:hypothetical protein